MRIVFGWHLDGPTWLETADGAAASLGTMVVGPAGLLRLLEERLGFRAPEAPQALRIAQYRSRLAAADDGTRFYSGSLQADGWETARLLLGWRDTLIASGWRGEPLAGGGRRLDTLSAVEAFAMPLAAGPADRLRTLLEVVSSADRPLVDELRLVTPFDLMPDAWRRLLSRLADAGTAVTFQPMAQTHRDSDLGSLARWVDEGTPAACRNDGSVVVLEADDEWLAAEAVAGWLAAAPADNDGVVIVRGHGTSLLDEACHRLGLPRVGGTGRSRWRGALQVLPLALENAWAPLNVHRLLELLTLPQSPIPPAAAAVFAAALQESPGIGGTAWQNAWPKAVERRRERLSARGLTDADLERRLKRDVAEWRDWLESPRVHPADGLPAAAAAALCRRVQTWALRRASATGDPVFQAAATEAGALAAVIDACGLDRLPKTQLDRMLDAVVADGVTLPHSGAEAALWSAVETPGQIWAPAPTVVWWGFVDAASGTAIAPWTAAERQALEAAGCLPESAQQALGREAWAWRQPLRYAQQRLVLVMPRTVAGEAAPGHPLWHEIGPALSRAGCAVHAAVTVRQEEVFFAGRTVRLVPVVAADLPQPRRTWYVPADAITAREDESATSLERLLGCPFAWVLNYRARVRPGALRAIPEGPQLIGTLAHAIIARLYGERPAWPPADAERRAGDLFDALLPELAAPLLLSGKSLERERARASIAAAARTLATLITDAGLTVQACEDRRDAVMPDGTKLGGTIDMLLADAQGRPVILDLKWSGRDTHRRTEIAEGRAIQLAVYSRLVAGQQATVPAGYFMIRQRSLFFTATTPFPPETHVPGSDLHAVWHDAWESRRRSLDRLRSGVVHATGAADGDDEGPADPSDPLTLEPSCRFCDYGRLCGAGSAQ